MVELFADTVCGKGPETCRINSGVGAKALVETLTATQAETEVERLGDLLAYVNAKALVDNFGGQGTGPQAGLHPSSGGGRFFWRHTGLCKDRSIRG